MVLEEEDILQDRKGARCVSYLSSGTDCGVPAVAVNSGQSLGILQTEKGLRWICQILLLTDYNCSYCIISSALISWSSDTST
jgi:hypothetical protein